MKRFIFVLAVLTLVLGIFTGCEADTYVKSGVMLYEVYTAGGYNSGETQAPYKNSYAVLYNSSKSDVAIDGWQLLSCNDEGVSIQEQSATLSGTIPAGGFFVISGGIAPDAGLNSAGEFEEENVVGADLPFDIDLDASDFKPNRKEGIIVLASGDVQGSINQNERNVEDYLAYGEEYNPVVHYDGEEPVAGVSVKKVLRRITFKDSDNNLVDFETKDIVDKPGNIIYYTADTSVASLSKRMDWSDSVISLSSPAGVYQSEFQLTISTNLGANPQIYYTLDGTAPISPLGVVSETAILYEESVRIYDRTTDEALLMSVPGTTAPRIETDSDDIKWPPAQNEGETDSAYETRLNELFTSTFKANVLRIAAVNDDKAVTPTVTASYFISEEGFAARYNMPVISIFTDRNGLFDSEKGIFMPQNRENRGIDGQIPSVFQYFDENGNLIFTETAKLQLNGGFTRMYPQKPFRINMSNALFNYDLFAGEAKDQSGNTITYFDRFILRAGGNDQSWGSLRDPFWQQYCAQLGTFGTQASRPATVFLDGEYWGTYFITERQDAYYINAHYGVPMEDVAIVESFFSLQDGVLGDEHELVELRDFIINNDMSIEENYKRFTDTMDVESYIDYFICEIYCGNNDWPHNNIKMWKNKNPDATENTKWKMLMQDVDWAFHQNEDLDSLADLITVNQEPNAIMFAKLLGNPEFKEAFISRFEYLLENFFVPEKIIAAYEAQQNEVSAALEEHNARWAKTTAGWDEAYADILRIVPKRTQIMREAIAKLES